MSAKHVATAAPLVAAVLVLLTSCTPDSRLASGECADMYGAEVCTWAVMEGETVVELGATVPLASIETAPADAEMVWPPQQVAAVRLPAEARESLGIDHLGINWEVHGHPPALFLTPHFDFYFFNATTQEVSAIDCSDLGKPERVPAGYTLPDIEIPEIGMLVGLCVPQMGMHAMLEEELSQTELFGASMLVGYYRGEALFFEPMLTRELLLQEAGFSLDVPAVENLPAEVRYPTQFRAEYDAENEAYRLIFTGFQSD